MSREETVRAIWDEVIRPPGRVDALRRVPAAARLLDEGADPDALTRLVQLTAYEAVFGCLYLVTGDWEDDYRGLHEDLLSGDPTGREGSDFLRGD
jgi:hypothetical protein